jgi:hypothetical protein
MYYTFRKHLKHDASIIKGSSFVETEGVGFTFKFDLRISYALKVRGIRVK